MVRSGDGRGNGGMGRFHQMFKAGLEKAEKAATESGKQEEKKAA